MTYRISKYPTSGQMTKQDVDKEIKKALDVWTDFTDLTFTQKRSGRVHIDISFLEGEHGDGDPFDGSGGTLAHAFFPVFGGDAHFDDKEFWTMESFRGFMPKKTVITCIKTRLFRNKFASDSRARVRPFVGLVSQ